MLCVLVCFMAVLSGRAQTAPYKFDFGADAGVSGYLGETNRSNIYAHPGFHADVAARYIYDSRWAFRGSIYTQSLSGTSKDNADVLPGGVVYDFSSIVSGLTVRAEFNFLPYGIGETYKRLRRASPYLALGLGFGICRTDGKTYAAPTLPMAFGVKFKAAPRVNLFLEFGITKAFSDHFDSPELADLNKIETAFYKNTDWYSNISVGFSYEFGKRCETCHYVD